GRRRPNEARWQQLVIRIRHDSVEDAHHAIALVVIVNWTALAAVPAQAQDFHLWSAVNQVASIVVVVKNTKVGHVVDADVKRVHQADQVLLGNALTEPPETV